MSDSYQAVYDAVRSRMSNCDIGEIARQVMWEHFDISWAKSRLEQEFTSVAYEMMRPSTVYKPAIYPDGNKWCALLGANLQEGVCGFGDTPAEAYADFDKAWNAKIVTKISKD